MSHKLRIIRVLRWAILLAFALAFVASLYTGVREGLANARCAACEGRIFAIGNSLHGYLLWRKMYPLPSGDAKTGPAVSWRVFLPDFVHPHIYERYRKDEPWNSVKNLALLKDDDRAYLYVCDGARSAARMGMTDYLAVIGPGTVWTETCAGHLEDPEKQAPEKILVVEVPHSDVPWTKPTDLSVEDVVGLYRAKPGLKDSRHKHGLHYVTASGHVGSFGDIKSEEGLLRLLLLDCVSPSTFDNQREGKPNPKPE